MANVVTFFQIFCAIHAIFGLSCKLCNLLYETNNEFSCIANFTVIGCNNHMISYSQKLARQVLGAEQDFSRVHIRNGQLQNSTPV